VKASAKGRAFQSDWKRLREIASGDRLYR